MKNSNRRLLLLSYFYPPLGGAGVQRPCKMVSYLQKKGWSVDVISVKSIVFHSKDKTLTKKCHENNLYPVNTLDPMGILYLFKKWVNKIKSENSLSKNKKQFYFNTPEKVKTIVRGLFPIDDKIGWFPFAYRKALELCKKNKYTAIMATIGPYTSGVVAYMVSRKCDLPLIVDYRDLWTEHPYIRYISIFHKRYSEYLEEKMLKRARVITTASKAMIEVLTKKYGKSLKNKFLTMYNAWDEKDFVNLQLKREKKDKIRFAYIGNFYGRQTPFFFIKALEELQWENKLTSEIELIFVGNYFTEVKDMLEQSLVGKKIKIIPQVTHKKALKYMMTADVLLLFISSFKGKGVLTGKIFEYLRVQKEIFAMIPRDGEAAELLKKANHKYICPMEELQEIKKIFCEIVHNIKHGKEDKHKILKEYSREYQINQFENFLVDKLDH